MTDTWDELWDKDIDWDRVTTIPFITERIYKIKAMGDGFNKQLKAVKKVYDEMYHDYMSSRTTPIVSNYIPKFREALEAEV